jgi:DinB family protein
MPDQSLLLLLDEVRGKTLRILGSISSEAARWAPPGLQNTILWHAGHSYFLLEWLTMNALGQAPQMPGDWYLKFSWDSRPGEVPAGRWTSLAEVIQRLQDQHDRMSRIIGELSADQLDQPAAGHPDDTVRYAILHALHDESCHSGEMHLLRKLQAAGKK